VIKVQISFYIRDKVHTLSLT